jgi:hypothetical protein
VEDGELELCVSTFVLLPRPGKRVLCAPYAGCWGRCIPEGELDRLLGSWMEQSLLPCVLLPLGLGPFLPGRDPWDGVGNLDSNLCWSDTLITGPYHPYGRELAV